MAAAARQVVVFTGAGLSAESGVATFRDAQTGLWAKYDPVMLASLEGFTADPSNVWHWYDQRRQQIAACEPNAAHHVLTAWEQRWEALGRSFTHITQNIDDLHHRAGAKRVIELHGNIWEARPLNGAYADARRLEQNPLTELPPVDAEGRLLRPHVVWFGEMLDPAVLARATELSSKSDLLLSCGTSSVVYPAASLPYQAQRCGAVLVEINPEPTELSPAADCILRGNACAMLTQLWNDMAALL